MSPEPVSHLCTYLEESAARGPQRLAVVDSDGSSLTYEELDQRANRVAGYLADLGVRAGDRVAVVLPKTTVAYTAMFGIMKARAAYVPIDWSGPSERTRAILASCQVRVALVDPRCEGLDGAADAVVPVSADTWNSILQHEPLVSDPAERQPEDLAHILFTSGSSGVPKGVMVTQRNVTSYVAWCAELLSAAEDDRFGNHAPFHFAMCVLDIFVPIKVGGSVRLVGETLGKNPTELARFIADQKITVWYSTPSILGLLAEFGELESLNCSNLRKVLFAGEPFQIKKLRQIVELLPNAEFYNLWGSTETNACTYAAIPRTIPADRTLPYPIGKAASHCSIMVLNDEAEQVARGAEGLMYISGPTVFPGYWGRETTFLERDGLKWHNTGDVVKESDEEGYIYVSRRDRMVKRHGFRVELGEVERALYRHSAISEAAVIALTDAEKGLRIIAYLVTRQTPRPSIAEMKVFCNQHLPTYMNPDVFKFVEALPRTRSNKVDYQTLIRKPL